MKNLLLLIIFNFLANLTFAQKSGFDDIRINDKLSDIKSLKKYRVIKDDEPGRWIVRGKDLRMFFTEFDHLELEVDKKETIKKITAYSKPITFKNYQEWEGDMHDLLSILDKEMRQVGSEYRSHMLPDDFAMVWALKEYKTALFFKTKKPDYMAMRFSKTFIFSWVEDKTAWQP